jgi:hypothetical protein
MRCLVFILTHIDNQALKMLNVLFLFALKFGTDIFLSLPLLSEKTGAVFFKQSVSLLTN